MTNHIQPSPLRQTMNLGQTPPDALAGAHQPRKPMSKLRLAFCALPAAGATIGLFALMQGLISAEHTVTETYEPLTISKITPTQTADSNTPASRRPVKIIDVAAPPPNQPAATATQADVFIPTPSYSGAVPARVIRAGLPTFDWSTTTLNDRGVKPIRPPRIDYPPRALARGLEGACEVSLDVDTRGMPVNVSATCTDKVFETAAEKAVKRSEFAPRIRRGKPVFITGVVYPLVFTISD